MFRLDQFDYQLPPSQIAHMPLEARDHSRLLVLDRNTGAMKHQHFYDLADLLQPTDVLIRNNTKVMPARLFGKKDTGGKCEVLLIRQLSMSADSCSWECMTKPGIKLGQTVEFAAEGKTTKLVARCTEITGFTRTLEFNQGAQGEQTFFQALDQIGHTPVPPYIEWGKQDEAQLREIYQTTYAKLVGSVAAPTAGLHFTPELDEKLKQKGIKILEVTLHVGLGTFLPLQDEQLKTQTLHHEWFSLSDEVATQLNQAKKEGRRCISVGTTTTRVLETCSTQEGVLEPQTKDTNIFLQPGYTFRFIDGLITNFHLPKSSLLFLVSALVTQPNTSLPFSTFAETTVGKAYEVAIQEGYRFFSFGDAMLII